MKTLLYFAFRNLTRQKRRAVLLGSAMALGTCFLVLASSFVAGISQTLFDRVMTYVAGHTSVIVCDRGYTYRTALRGEAGLKDRIAKLPHVKKVEETIGIMSRIVGPSKGDNGILIGTDMESKMSESELRELEDNFPMISGKFQDLTRTDVPNPAILSKGKAEFLGLKNGNDFSARFQDSRGRMQVAKFTLVGIFQPSNAFMEAPFFVSMRHAKALLDMDSTDLPYLYLTLENPTINAKVVADTIFKMLQPELASVPVRLEGKITSVSAVAAGVKTDSAARVRMASLLGSGIDWKGDVVALPTRMAQAMGVAVGDTLRMVSGIARTGDTISDRVLVAGLWTPPSGAADLVLWEEDAFQSSRSFRRPQAGDSGIGQVLSASKVLDTLLSPTWVRMPRALTTDDVRDQMRQIGARSWKAPVVAVRTMYETGEQIIKLADALNLITLVAVLILFLVVLTGVVNALRMTVRERTREIGTLRSLGMQASQVRTLFLMEAGLLSLLSALAGTALALVAMFALSQLTFPIEGNPLSMLLVRGHLVFVPEIFATIGQILLVIGMAVLAAWNPASQAAKLSPANALRHHE
ncbi:MAG: FtsX-like permease family protein [Fibrobacterota bacterium]|nr:FtsX-like permease family protein [Fibrobacterota bacterium]QQS06750.1 MAG: FtsX-like permease family protein [Fibrobacterota bacterium]